jgi:GT2 family glycosyltransferase
VEKSLSIIIVSYNVSELLTQCLTSLNRFLKISYEVIVIDNASSDGTPEVIRNNFPDVILIVNERNTGFTAANNQGLKIAKGRLVFFLNPDTELRNDSMNRLIDDCFATLPVNEIVGPQLVNDDGSFQNSTWKFPNVFHHFLELFFLHGIYNPSLYPMEMLTKKCTVDFISGAAILMHRETAKRLNGFDENLFWMDDVDLCKRNQAAGGITYFFPEATLVHYGGQSSKKNFNVQISNQIISKLKFYRKNREGFNFLFSVPVFFLHILSRVLLFMLLSPFNKVFLKKFFAYLFTGRKFFQFLFFGKANPT